MDEPKDKTERDPKLEEARQHLHEARDAMHKLIPVILPPAFAENRRRVRHEVLLAMRSILDYALERSEHVAPVEKKDPEVNS